MKKRCFSKILAVTMALNFLFISSPSYADLYDDLKHLSVKHTFRISDHEKKLRDLFKEENLTCYWRAIFDENVTAITQSSVDNAMLSGRAYQLDRGPRSGGYEHEYCLAGDINISMSQIASSQPFNFFGENSYSLFNITSNNIRLNLNGFKLEGDLAQRLNNSTYRYNKIIAVKVSRNTSTVIVNGEIEGFDFGIYKDGDWYSNQNTQRLDVLEMTTLTMDNISYVGVLAVELNALAITQSAITAREGIRLRAYNEAIIGDNVITVVPLNNSNISYPNGGYYGAGIALENNAAANYSSTISWNTINISNDATSQNNNMSASGISLNDINNRHMVNDNTILNIGNRQNIGLAASNVLDLVVEHNKISADLTQRSDVTHIYDNRNFSKAIALNNNQQVTVEGNELFNGLYAGIHYEGHITGVFIDNGFCNVSVPLVNLTGQSSGSPLNSPVRMQGCP
jgi:hypothetical protein